MSWHHTSFLVFEMSYRDGAPFKIYSPNNSCSRAVTVNQFEGNFFLSCKDMNFLRQRQQVTFFQNDYEEKNRTFKLKNTLKKYTKAVYKLHNLKNASY